MISPGFDNLLRKQPSRREIVVNGRFQLQKLTGVQRYAHEIVSRLSEKLDVITPTSTGGVTGHLWEQSVLPWLSKGRLLWSPNASGPLLYARQVVTFHDIFPIEHPEWYSDAYAQWYGLVMRRLALQAVHLIAVSTFTKSRIVEKLGRDADDITVVANGCHVRGRASDEKIRGARHALALPSPRYILMLSSQEKRKNTETMLKAWSSLQAVLSDDIWLVLAGPKADTNIYGQQATASDLPRVFYTGYVPDEHLAGLYSGASLFVFPSLAEGFGLPLLEAMACGVRCIASNTSSLPEVGGDAVLYVDPLAPHQFVEAVKFSLAKDCSVPFVPSLQQSERFTWDVAADKTLQVLHASLGATAKQEKLGRSMQRSNLL
ncbi:MAG: glycosyltransferase family 4 protein [Acidobacteria bacterium]|nr:glycosyltransferase family 4 protein [Acidobacteriota bacterium]